MLFSSVVPALTGAATSVTAYADSVMRLDEVAVTAVKGGNDLRHMPVAVTTLGAAAIEAYNIVNMKQVSEIAPNFYIPEYGSRMTSSIYVRGIGARIDQPVVGLNVDNVPVLNKDNYDFDLPDISRIEVMRGPQSTLYGRNTMGGVINIYTFSPLSYQGLRLTAEYGSKNSYRISAGCYGRLSERWGMSLTGAVSGTDGFFRNRCNGSRVGEERQWSLRHKTAARPSEHLVMENVASVSRSRQGGYPYESLATGLIAYGDTCFYRRTSVMDGLTVRWRRDGLSLSSVTGFQYVDDNMTLDQDFLPQDYFTITQRRREWALTQDVVVKGRKDRYKWLGGAFGFYKRGEMSAPVTFKDYGIEKLIVAHRNEINPSYPIKWNEPQFCLNSDFTLPTWGAALYHQSEYTSGQWSVTVGLRLDYEHVAIDYHNYTATGYTVYDAGTGAVYREERVDIDEARRLSKQFVQLLPKLSVSYTLPGNLGNLYVNVAKGYKSGGYNTQMFSDFLQQKLMAQMGMSEKYDVDRIIGYRPEKSWNYEIGTHLNLIDGCLELDGTAFYIDCRDQQLTMFPDGSTTGRVMTNAGKTRSVGVEVSGILRLGSNWSLRASYGHSDARFVKFFNGKTDYNGRFVPYAPLNTAFAGATYSVGLPGTFVDRLSVNVDCRGVGRIYWSEENDVSQPFYLLPSASVTVSRGALSVEAWCSNFTSTRYDTFYFVSIGNAFVQRGMPARGGVTLRFNLDMQ